MQLFYFFFDNGLINDLLLQLHDHRSVGELPIKGRVKTLVAENVRRLGSLNVGTALTNRDSLVAEPEVTLLTKDDLVVVGCARRSINTFSFALFGAPHGQRADL